LRVLYVSGALYSGNGSIVHAQEFLSALSSFPDENVEVDILPENLFIDGKFKKLLSFLIPSLSVLSKTMDKMIDKKNYDLVIIRNFYDISLPRRVKKKNKNSLVFVEFNDLICDRSFMNFASLNRYFVAKEIDCISCADMIFPVSSQLEKRLRGLGVDSGKVTVNHNGVSVEKFDNRIYNKSLLLKEYKILNDSLVLCYTGSITKAKKLDLVIESIRRVSEKVDNKLFFILATDGKAGDEIDMILKAKLKSYVGYNRYFWLPHDDIPKLLAISNIGLFPFTSPYMSPLKLFEYLAMGVLTIGPRTPAVEEVFDDGNHLILVDDQPEFEDMLLEMIKNYDRFYESIASRGAKHVRENYTWKKNVERVLGKYFELVALRGN